MTTSAHSTHLLTASADATCKMWNVESGEEVQTFKHRGPVRGVAWGEGSQVRKQNENENTNPPNPPCPPPLLHKPYLHSQCFATISDPFMDAVAMISIYDCPLDSNPEVS